MLAASVSLTKLLSDLTAFSFSPMAQSQSHVGEYYEPMPLFPYDMEEFKRGRLMKLYLDPGHGGSDPGATGNGLKEKILR